MPKTQMAACKHAGLHIKTGKKNDQRANAMLEADILPASNLSSSSVHCPSFLNLCQTKLKSLVVLNSH